MNEEGVVDRLLKGDWVVVRFDRKSACDNCRMCLKPKDAPYVELKLKNKINAKVGDTVMVSMGERAVIKASFIVYILPLMILAATLLISVQFVEEWIAFLISIFSLTVAFALVSALDKLIKKDKEYLPRMVSIIDKSKQKEVIMTKVIELNDETFKNAIISDKLTLVDFWATWCMPCKALAPILETVAEELGDKCNICKLDVDIGEATASKYSIMSIPTMIIFQNGEVKEKMVGVRTKAQIIAALEKFNI